ncbi:hypothetical protein CDV36_001907 [Fusarium kuroshium]|uniref:Periplasmic copper-binding protein NosD beta helix domain-containing protein n=1 Tax=Fusarium kuroshium TaxID=2010991 RepID=A0A3M2SLD7_9HYPO|nr:hypothetical protein CDV36_001907 [Fusarium kuroshium]
MKFTSALGGLLLLGSVSASPVADDSGLQARGKCQYKDKTCCAPDNDKIAAYGRTGYYPYRQTIYVKAHKSIQAAINKAHAGDKIVVAAGIYAEQITISKDGIELVGKKGAVIVPPKKFKKNTCSGLSGPKTEAGICVTGRGVQLEKFITEHRRVLGVNTKTQDVSVSGFEVRKFSGLNIAVVGCKNTRITGNTLTDGGKYGTLTAGSVKTLIQGNKVSNTGLGPIAICMDNFSDVLVKDNNVANHNVGLCVQTDGADVQYNRVTQSCVGIFADPGTKGAKIRHNYVGPSNPKCDGAAGIILDGTIGVKVTDNVVEGQHKNQAATAVVLVDDPCVQTGPNVQLACLKLKKPAIATNNIFMRNTFRDNDLDIYTNTTGKGNVFKCNNCKTSFPIFDQCKL